MDPTSRFHPSTITKSMILNGSEIMMGGSIIMPMDRRMDATTISMMRNGMNRMNPIWNAVLSSDIMNAGIRALVGTSSLLEGFSCFTMLMNRERSFSLVCLNMKSLKGVSAFSRAWENDI